MADEEKKISLSFAALNPYIEQSIISPKEEKYPGREFIQWGDRNAYPDYLEDLCENVASLQSIIDGSADYVCGERVNVSRALQGQYMNRKNQTADDLVRELAVSFFTYGGFAVQVIRSQSGDIVELYAMDMKNLRCDKDNEVFYYSETWNRRFSMVKTIVYPKFIPDARGIPSSVLFVKNTAYHTYPRPKYAACLKACEIERSIDEYHLNSINNGFMGSVLVNFNNGTPTDEEQEEIEKGINEKFAGKAMQGESLSPTMTRRITPRRSRTSTCPITVTATTPSPNAAVSRSSRPSGPTRICSASRRRTWDSRRRSMTPPSDSTTGRKSCLYRSSYADPSAKSSATRTI